MSGPRQIELIDYGKGGMKGLDGDIPIVDVDEVFMVCMRACRRQIAANVVRIEGCGAASCGGRRPCTHTVPVRGVTPARASGIVRPL